MVPNSSEQFRTFSHCGQTQPSSILLQRNVLECFINSHPLTMGVFYRPPTADDQCLINIHNTIGQLHPKISPILSSVETSMLVPQLLPSTNHQNYHHHLLHYRPYFSVGSRHLSFSFYSSSCQQQRSLLNLCLSPSTCPLSTLPRCLHYMGLQEG